MTDANGQRLAAVSRGLRWEYEDGRIRDLTFTVATDIASYRPAAAELSPRLARRLR